MLNGSPEDLANTLYGLIEETKISLLVSSYKYKDNFGSQNTWKREKLWCIIQNFKIWPLGIVWYSFYNQLLLYI